MYDKGLPAKAELDTERVDKGKVGLSASITWESCVLFVDVPIILKSDIGRLVVRGENPVAQLLLISFKKIMLS